MARSTKIKSKLVVEDSLELKQLTPDTVPVLDENKEIKSSTISLDELSSLTGIEGPIQPQLNDLNTFGYDAVVCVSKNGSDSNSGKQHSPFLTITAAMDSITDASPTKRYVILVQSGAYTEAALSLKANVFIVGEGQKESVRITGPVSMHSSFSGTADHRSGFSQVSLLSACDFNWQTVTSGAGKLYFNEVSFSSTINMFGHNNATAQAQFNSCNIFGNLTISGINVGVFTNNVCFANVTLNQHPNGGMATILAASGGHCNGTITQNASVNDFGRRSASFLRHFPSEQLILNGPSVYADIDLISQGKQAPIITNGANLIPLTDKINHDLTTKNLNTDNITSALIKPKATNTHNMGDWGTQWFWNFGYVHASTGTDLFLVSYGSAFGPDSSGKSIGIYTDGGGLQENVNSGEIILQTATTSGTGVRGKITLNGREIDVTNKQIKNVANGTDPQDAVTVSQLGTALDLKQDALGFTPEDVANKSTDIELGTSNTLYPTQNAVKVFVENSISAASVPDATSEVKGKIKLAGDLSGTADAPTVPELANKEPTIEPGTTSQYWRGDKSWQTLDKTAVGLDQVDNTSDLDKPISSAVQDALDLKYDASNPDGFVNEQEAADAAPVQSVNLKTGDVVLNKSDIGLDQIDNTSDLDKPISSATQDALDLKYDASNPAGYITLAEVPESAVTSVNTKTGDVVLDKSDIGLDQVDNTSDLDKPISSAVQDALDLKYDASNPDGFVNTQEAADAAPIQSVNSRVGDITLDKTDVGLDQVDNTSDLDKPISTATQAALDLKQDDLGFTPEDVANKSTNTSLGTSDTLYPTQNAVKVFVENSITSASVPDATTEIKGKIKLAGDLSGTADLPTVPGLANKIDSSREGQPDGIATLDSTGKVPATQLPSYVDDVIEADDFASLPDPGETGKIYVTLDNNKTYRWSGSTYIEISPSEVNSVNGQTGIVVLDKDDVGLGNVDNTSDLDKPISTATQSALDLKYDASNPDGFVDAAGAALAAPVQSVSGKTGIVTLEKADVGLGNVDNTNDLDKPISTATQSALDLKYDASNPAGYITLAQVPESTVTSVNTKTGDVVLDKSDIGLDQVDNTSDLDKPVSTATQAALDLKYDASNPDGYITLAEVPVVTSPGDIKELSFSLLNSQLTPQSITGFAFSDTQVRGFTALVTVEIDADSDIFEQFTLNGIQKNGSWNMSIESIGDNTNVVFSITSTGQIQYISDDYTGFVAGSIKFRAITTSI
jgi:hypothetical protein